VLPRPTRTRALVARWQAEGRWPAAAALALGGPSR
jgi:hypothetical protein